MSTMGIGVYEVTFVLKFNIKKTGINAKSFLCLTAILCVAFEAHFFHLSLKNSSELDVKKYTTK